MRNLLFFITLLLLISGFVNQETPFYKDRSNENFIRGEVLHYKMSYGFFTIGKGSAQIYPQYFKINNRDCFKVEVKGRTVGMVDWVADLDDEWSSLVDTVTLMPHQFYRRIREGNYKKDEWTNFDQAKKKIEVKTLDNNTGKLKESKFYDAPGPIRDMLSGYLFLRGLDFTKIQPKDTITVTGFFEDNFYKMKIIYKGKETIRSKVGKIRTLVLVPVMPDNKIFDGENSVTAWFSDDKNRVPVKINAELFIGSAGVELTSYSGLRNPLNLVN